MTGNTLVPKYHCYIHKRGFKVKLIGQIKLGDYNTAKRAKDTRRQTHSSIEKGLKSKTY